MSKRWNYLVVEVKTSIDVYKRQPVPGRGPLLQELG